MLYIMVLSGTKQFRVANIGLIYAKDTGTRKHHYPHYGNPKPTQLDRIESKLTELLALLKPKSIESSLHTID